LPQRLESCKSDWLNQADDCRKKSLADTMKNQNILFLGCGKMGTILLAKLLDGNAVEPSQINVIKPSQKNKIPQINYFSQAKLLPPNYCADIVFIAVKPQISEKILSEFLRAKKINDKTIFISILAGKKIAFFKKIFGKKSKIIRAMPNLPISVGEGVFPYLANKNITKIELQNLQEIFVNFGENFIVKKEADFDFMTAIFGSGPAYIFYLQEIFLKIAIGAGIPKNKAKTLIRKLFLGSALMSQNNDFSELQKSVTSSKGTTDAALQVLQKKSALEKLFDNAIKAAIKRSNELST
jgi:pyrroline-5-carboxylate reductase